MNFQNLQDQTAYWLDDLNFGYFSTTQVQRWLNNGQLEVQKLLLQAKANYYVTRVQTTLVVNQNDYVLPLDFLTEHRLEIVMSGIPPNESTYPLAPMTVNQQDLVPSSTGTPGYYFFKKNRITLFPAPDTALTLRLYYSYRVSDMTLATDIPDVPAEYHEMLAVLATIDGLMKDGRSPSAMIAKREYYERMLKEESQDRNEDSPRRIVSTGSAGMSDYGYF